MTDHGIPFKPHLAQKVHDGSKTQTRRLLRVEAPHLATSAGVFSNSKDGQLDNWEWLSGDPSCVEPLPTLDTQNRFLERILS